ncbi:apolipoprotein D-like isoform X2 [Haematobia irritans]
MANFDTQKYLGNWYEYAKYPTRFEGSARCVMVQYTLKEDEGKIYFQNTMLNKKTNTYDKTNGLATVELSGMLFVNYAITPLVEIFYNYWILDTNYQGYAVVYSCETNANDSHSIFVWILTREREPHPMVVYKAVDVLKKNNISLHEITITDQCTCD